jgi:hypothetical protein
MSEDALLVEKYTLHDRAMARVDRGWYVDSAMAAALVLASGSMIQKLEKDDRLRRISHMGNRKFFSADEMNRVLRDLPPE